MGAEPGKMAASGESGASGGGGSTEEAFMTFYSEVTTERNSGSKGSRLGTPFPVGGRSGPPGLDR